MSAKPTTKHTRSPEVPSRGRADLAHLRRMTDAEIERTSPLELRDLPADFWKNVELVDPVIKEAISLRVDADVLSWFREQGPRYQSRMNAVLRAYMRAHETPSKKRSRPTRRVG
jgi:uncharacterized protein (DUF4415 family)